MFKYSYLAFAAVLGALATALIFRSFGVGSITPTPTVSPTGHAHSGATEEVHFHANFAVYTGTGFVDFSGETYMEELQSCTKGVLEQLPRDRTHQHEGK